MVIDCGDGIFNGTFDVGVHDREDIKTVIENLKKIPDLQEVSRTM